jgi:ArpU family phage transcriptional regulator
LTENERQLVEYRRRYSTVESILKNLEGYKVSIGILQARIDEIEADNDEHLLSAVDTTKDGSSPTNAFHSIVETDAISRVDTVERLKAKLKRSEHLVGLYEQALSILPHDEQMILDMRYIEGQQWWQISSALHMSERTAKYKRKNAIHKMIIAIYGEDCTNFALLSNSNVI